MPTAGKARIRAVTDRRGHVAGMNASLYTGGARRAETGVEVKLGATMPVNRRRCVRWTAGTALAMTPVLIAAGCTGDGPKRDSPPLAKVIIMPGSGAAKVRPDGSIVVRVTAGTLQDVTVVTEGNKV